MRLPCACDGRRLHWSQPQPDTWLSVAPSPRWFRCRPSHLLTAASQIRVGALAACAEALDGVLRASAAGELRRHLQSEEAGSIVGYASSVFLQARGLHGRCY